LRVQKSGKTESRVAENGEIRLNFKDQPVLGNHRIFEGIR